MADIWGGGTELVETRRNIISKIYKKYGYGKFTSEKMLKLLTPRERELGNVRRFHNRDIIEPCGWTTRTNTEHSRKLWKLTFGAVLLCTQR